MKILKIIFEINTKLEISQILDKILKWSRESKNAKDELKVHYFNSVPKELYGKTFKICRFSTQVLEVINEMEIKI